MPGPLDHLLLPDGPIARRLGAGFEVRPQQREMVEAVRSALRGGEKLLVEAGTGVGKSFAYLLPVIEVLMGPACEARDGIAGWEGGTAEVRGTETEKSPHPGPLPQKGQGVRTPTPPPNRKRRVVISTHTIALQEQLIERDIPLLRAVCGQEFSAVLVKGRGNYLSLRRLAGASKRQVSLFADGGSLASLHAIEDWAYETGDGSLATLPQMPRADVWERVQSDSANCMGRRCPTYDRCFYQRARRRMEGADILVVNHALFFSDLALRKGGVAFLPDYDHVILDEAHTVEDVAADHFGLSLTQWQVTFLLGHLYNSRTGKGFLATLDEKLAGEEAPLHRAVGGVADAEAASHRLFEGLVRYSREKGRSNGRIDDAGCVPNDLTQRLKELAVLLQRLWDRVTDEADRFELVGYATRCEALAATAEALIDQSEAGCVYWLEVSEGRGGERTRKVRLAASPVDVGPTLRETLFEAGERRGKAIGVVMTSATLATGNGEGARGGGGEGGGEGGAKPRAASDAFKHVRSRLGCDDASSLLLGSPFDYAKQAELWVTRRMPDPSSPRFLDELGPAVLRHVRATDGGAFVLFTSYAAMNRVAGWLRPRLDEHGLPMLVQGEGEGRSQMLERFRGVEADAGQNRAVLLGTDSFWQGVDVRGSALRNVIITRLPFAVPDRPLIEARVQRIKDRGGNAFGELSLPEAILKFKQGFGRLIRSASDRGRVVVLDPRLVTKGYGKQFLRALPEMPVRYDEGEGVDAAINSAVFR